MSGRATLRLVCPELVGRDTELSTIGQLIGSTANGTGGTLLLSGEAGLGKTALLARAFEIARRAGLRVLRGECVRFEMGRAFGPFVDALHPLRTEPLVAAALAVTPSTESKAREPGAPVDRYRAHGAFLRAFGTAAEERALLIAIDDLHWADESTLELFAHLSRRLTERILLIGTYRPEEVARRPALRRALGDLARLRLWDLAIPRLTTSDVGRALRLILGSGTRVSTETREVLQARSAGNPLFLEEMLRALAQRGELQKVEDGWRLGPISDLPLPASVQDAVRERFATFDPVAREVMLLAATTGERFDIDLIVRASGASESAVIGAIRDAISGQLVVEAEGDHDDAFAFRHSVIRDAILEEVLRVERRALHRRVAEALEREGPQEEAMSALAYHWDEAGDRERAFTYHRRAGEQEARRFAHAEALGHFERALQLVPDDDPTVAGLSMRAAAMAKVLGREGRVLDHAAAAARLWERAGDRKNVGAALLTMYDAAGGMLWSRAQRLELIEHAFEALGPLGETPELAWAHGTYALHVATSAGDLATALTGARRAVAIAERFPGGWRSNVYGRLALIEMLLEDREGAIASLRRAVAVSEEQSGIHTAGGPWWQGLAPGEVNYFGLALADLIEQAAGETDEVRSLRHRAHTLSDRYGVMQNYMSRLHMLLLTGDWDEYVRVHDDHLDDPDEAAYVLAHHALHRAFIEVARKGPSALPAARAAYEKVLRSEDVSESDAVVVPEIALVAGDTDLALDALERAADLVSRPDPTRPFLTFAGVYAILAARDAKDDAAARTWIDRFPAEVPRLLTSLNVKAIEHAIRYGALERSWAEGRHDHAIDALANLVEERVKLGQNSGRLTLRGRRKSASERTAATVTPPAALLGQPLPDLPGHGVWPLLTYFLALREIEMRVERGAAGDHDQAALRLDWVVDFYRRGRASWYLERLRERAGAWGIPFPADPDAAPVALRLTRREREVATLVAQGMTNKEIADRLTLSVRTAESHVERIRSKLGFHTRAQVAVWATETYGPPS